MSSIVTFIAWHDSEKATLAAGVVAELKKLGYLVYYEIRAAYKRKEHVFSAMSRNNLESGFDNGAVELGLSFPLWSYPYLKGYVQYFTGYGESLINYDQYMSRIGIGVALTDWL
ncbi:MAG: phospholipase A1 [Desulforhopalus sp.]|jgi:phospholipase A1